MIILLKLFDMSLRYTLDQLQTFVAVAETGSFSAAGRALNRVQSAISYTVGQLELAIDAELFDQRYKMYIFSMKLFRDLQDFHFCIARKSTFSTNFFFYLRLQYS